MADLSNQTPADTYKSLLQIGDATNGVDATAKYIEDGEGTNSALAISTTAVGIGTDSPQSRFTIKCADLTNEGGLRIIKSSIDNAYFDNYINNEGNLLWAYNGQNLITLKANGNVGIGTDSPTAKLKVVDEKTGGDIVKIDISPSTAGNPAGLHIQNSNVNLDEEAAYLKITDQAGNHKLRVQKNGNVGIGTNSPSALLDLNNGTSPVDIQFTETSTSYHKLGIRKNGALLQFGEYNNTGDAFLESFLTIIADDGNVGIGTTDPLAPLHVYSPETTSTSLRLTYGGDSSYYADYANGFIKGYGSNASFKISLNDDEKIRIRDDGNVGIGTDSPSSKLEVVDGGSAVRINQNGASSITFESGSLADLHIGHDGSSNKLNFSHGSVVNNTKLLTINANDGNVGIGTDSPDAKLDVQTDSFGDILRLGTLDGNNNPRLLIGSSATGIYIKNSWNTGAGNLDFQHADGTSKMYIKADGNVGIGTDSPSVPLEVNGVGRFNVPNGGRSLLSWSAGDNTGENQPVFTLVTNEIGNANRVTLNSDGDSYFNGGNVGIGTTSPSATLQIDATDNSTDALAFWVRDVSKTNSIISAYENGNVKFGSFNYEDSGGKVGIGTASPDAKLHIPQGSTIGGIDLSNACILAGNTSTGIGIDDNEIIKRQGTNGGHLNIGSQGVNSAIVFKTGADTANGDLPFDRVLIDSDGNVTPGTDDAQDIGSTSKRWDDIYATNATIQTSDRELKQDIEELSEAETRVAQACKGLLRKYRWKSSVEEKGDDARIHFGIMAQDLEAAFAAEGLDAGRYGMFIKNTWWEADRVIPAVETVEAVEAVYDEEGNEVSPAVEAVEAQPERTERDIFDNIEDAPEGATEVTQRGVRYAELLAFIIAAA